MGNLSRNGVGVIRRSFEVCIHVEAFMNGFPLGQISKIARKRDGKPCNDYSSSGDLDRLVV